MKRRNIQLAFIGEGASEGSSGEETTSQLMMGDEAVELAVAGGAILLVVPAGTPDERLFDSATSLGGELRLENGLRLSFEIKDSAIGGLFSASPERPGEELHEGLSSISQALDEI